ncbi:MAG: ABC-F family ATP-binding cassette domain-containing protein [bacterium]|nr:ABC-F family ATP-binding cassette domain-containing protein [bacterium]
MLQIRNLTYSIGDRKLLDDTEWVINPGKRSALVGPNGAGKTTLMRILMDQLEYDSGSIIKPKGYSIGYLPQEEVTMEAQTVLKTVLDGQKEINRLQEQITKLHHDLEEHTTLPEGETEEKLLKRLGDLEHRFEFLDGYHVEATAKSILTGLGFSPEGLHRPLGEFSGGWRMRAYLAILLVQKPDLLLLDEPTNHLDIPSIEWLEQYLLSFKGSIITVSHDRFFIDRLAQEIVELDRGKLVVYSGNYHFFENTKEEREALLLKKWKEQKAERERQEKFINRFRYQATKAAQVQSRIKLLDKMVDIDVAPPKQHIDFNLKVETTSYNDVLTVEDLWFKYEDDAPWVLEDISLNLYRGDKVSLVGINGAGKTTMTRLMVEQLKPQKGLLETGQRTTIGYYAQHQVDTLDLEATIYDEIYSTIATVNVPRIRDILGMFQLKGDDVYKRIGVLSGGEKARVSLAKILLSPVNFLIMDEPTNHLDKESREALENALANYNGTLVLISHDRYFLDKLVSRVWELKDHRLKEYDGNYSEYLAKRDTIEVVRQKDQKAAVPGTKKTKEQKRLEAQARQAISKDLNKIKREVEKLEDEIHRLEESKTDLEIRMALPETYENGQLAVTLQKEYGTATKRLEECNRLWEEKQMELDELSIT